MRAVSVIYSNMSSIRPLINEYTKGCQSSILHVYSGVIGSSTLSEICRKLRMIFRNSVIVGTISAGEIVAGVVLKDARIVISGMFFDKSMVKCIRYDGVSGGEEKVGKSICETANSLDDIKAVELLFPGSTVDTMSMYGKLSNMKKGVDVFGGYAGGHSISMLEHFVFDENGVYDNSIFSIFYMGSELHVNSGKSVGWHKIGKTLTVTKASGNTIYEIDNRPAVEVYEKYLQIHRDSGDFIEDTSEFPLLLVGKDYSLLRHTTMVGADGSLTLAGYVDSGLNMVMCFGDTAGIVADVDKRLEELTVFNPEAILLFSCMVRRNFWGKNMGLEVAPFQKLGATSGFYTWGEVSRESSDDVVEHNITLLSVGMREGDNTTILPEVPTIDDSVLSGQASLLSRLTRLVSSCTTELMNSYEQIENLNKKLMDANEHDKLTGIYNRGKIESLILKSLSTNEQTSLIMVDIDHFKSVNDEYGHDVGDTVLVGVSHIMNSFENCQVGRWGGEEFFILLENVGLEEASGVAESIRKEVEKHIFEEMGRNVTISSGVITSGIISDSRKVFIDVDKALYKAKNNGRNQVVIA